MNNKRPVIYLAGTASEREYRKYVKNKYSNNFNLVDPFDYDTEDYILKELAKETFPKQLVLEIINRDKDLIKCCDILVAYITKITVGTTMEILLSWELAKDIYIINPTLEFKRDMWLSYHITKMFSSIDECFDFCKEEYKWMSSLV